MKNKSFIYRGFEIIENSNTFNIYHENDKLLKIIPKDNKQSFKVVETFINEYLRKEN
tara:strand:- start:175 stop:345 length:171 start_codon:yes stop_codon:yes gene_type:complete